jgi:hypothetical protein
MKNNIKRIIKFLSPHRLLVIFFAGFFLALSIIFKIDANYTEELFIQLGKHILEEASLNHDNIEQTVVRAMNVTYSMQKDNRKNLFQYNPKSFKAKYMRSTELDLLDATGACGSASLVLARTYMSMGFPTRIGQMYANGRFGGHILVEVWSNDRWMVMDPLFNQVFYKPDSTLASFSEVQNNFAFYSKQLYPDYPKEYQFQNVRYTNWEKIPLLSPLFKKTLDIIYGEQRANQFCLRKYVIKFYLLWHSVFLFLFSCCAVFGIIQWWVHKTKIK